MYRTHDSLISWLALGVGVIALIIAIAAYNRTGSTIEEMLRLQANEVTETISQEAMEFGWEARLTSLRTRIEAEEDMDDIEEDLAELRRDIQQAGGEAEIEGRQWLEDMDDDLANVETQLRINTAQALASLESAIERARQEMIIDEE